MATASCVVNRGHSLKRAWPLLSVMGREVPGQTCHQEWLISRCPVVPWKVTS